MDNQLINLTKYEIPVVIEKASLFGGKITQPSPRLNTTAPIKRIDVDIYGTMLIKFNEDFAIENERPISIKLNYRNVSFLLDSTEYSVEGNTLITQLPKAAKAIAVRDNERYVLPLNSKIASSIYRIEKRGGNLETNAFIIDVSRKGLALMISDHEEGDLLANDHIWIRTINNIQLSDPIFGTIVYAHQRKYKDGKLDTKVGVSLDGQIPEEIFFELQRLCQLVLKA